MSDVAEEEALLDVAQEDGLPDVGEVVVGSRVHNDSMVTTEGSQGRGFGSATVAGLR